MKATLTNPANIAANRIHSLMAIAGIVIAIICSLVLFKDSQSSQDEARQSNIIESSKAVISNQVVKVMEVSVSSIASMLQ